MPRVNRFQLLGGPYLCPRTRIGGKLFCEIRGTVTVGSITDARIHWPCIKRSGTPSLVLCGDLVKAVRRESVLAITHHFGVSRHTVQKWRGVLKVPQYNTGTLRLESNNANARTDDRLERARANSKTPEALAKLSATYKSRPLSKAFMEASRKADHRHTEEWKKNMRQYHASRRVQWPPEQIALLGTDTDAAVAKKLGRKLWEIIKQRMILGITRTVEINGKELRRLRTDYGLTQQGLDQLASLKRRTVERIENTPGLAIRRDVAMRLSNLLGGRLSVATIKKAAD